MSNSLQIPPPTVAVIGAGPAGITAAIHFFRSGLHVLLFEKNEVGGLIRNARRVENFIGFSNPIDGPQAAGIFRSRLAMTGISVISYTVTAISTHFPESRYLIHSHESSWSADAVLCTIGTCPLPAGIANEDKLVGSHVFYEVAALLEAPIAAMQQQKVVVVGGGDAAFDYALNLADRGFKVMIAMRGQPSCISRLLAEALQRGIQCMQDVEFIEFRVTLGGIHVVCRDTTLDANAVLIAVGRIPVTLSIDAKDTEGIQYAGDVCSGKYRQLHIATGDALKKAMIMTEYVQLKYHRKNT